MRSFKITFLILWVVTIFSCEQKRDSASEIVETKQEEFEGDQEKQEAIINQHLKNGAWKHPLYSQEWQAEINKGLAKDSTIAYLWQQKAMPLFKQGKYEIGMEFLDQAVKYDRRGWQDYRAFIKCIFAKTYQEAIVDFDDYKSRYGHGYVMDHSFDFYIAVSHLQLNNFEKAEEILEADYAYQLAEKGKDWLHHLDFFYFGITKYELKKYEEAIDLFDLALEKYPDFSDVQYYKAACLRKLGRTEEAKKYEALAEANGQKGNTFNEANSVYERYPYQVRWH